MSRVAIVGSCITRDLWRFRGQGGADLLYISRTSLPSLFATPVAGLKVAARPPGGLSPQPHRALVTDLRKTALAALIDFRPTHLMLDFIDERYDLLSIDGALATHSWELEASGYRRQPALREARIIPRLSAAAERLWLEGAAEFAAFVRATPLRDAALILHSAQWADRRRTAHGGIEPISQVEILPGRPADLAQHNALLRRYEAAFAALMPEMATLAAPDERFADDSHQWGPSPFHYAPDYYAAIAAQLADLGLDLGVDR